MLRRITVLLGSLAIIIVAAPVAAGGGGCHGPITDEAGTTVMMSQFCFSPTVVRVDEGATVTWENMDSVDHNVVSSAFPGYGTATLRHGGSESITFDDAGIYPYVCSFHPGMTGAVVVGDADTPPPAAVVASNPVAEATSLETSAVEPIAASKGYAALTARVQSLEAALLFAPATPVEQPSWPPLVVGLLAGLVIGGLVLRGRMLS